MRCGEQPKATDPMKTPWRDMLQKPAQKLARDYGHLSGLVIAMTTVAKGDRPVGAGDDGTIGDSGTVNVAAEVFEHAVAALNRLFAVDDPTLLAGDVRESDIGLRSSSEPHESSPKQAS